MEALTIWQPWAWAIGAGLKLVENRSWLPSWKRLKEGDDLAIHAGAQAPSREDYHSMRLTARSLGLEVPSINGNEFSGAFGRGRIVAVATFAGIARARGDLAERQRPWWVGPYGWLLTNVRQLNLGTSPMVLGQQGLWPLTPGLEQRVRGQLAGLEGQLWRKTA